MTMAAAPDSAKQFDSDIIRRRGVLGRLVALALAVLLLGQIIVAWFAVVGFERVLEPQLSRKAQAVGLAVAEQIRFAVNELGIPTHSLAGVDPYFDNVLATNPDIAYLALFSPDGQVLYSRGLPPELNASLGDMPAVWNQVAESGAELGGFINRAFLINTGQTLASVLHVGVWKEYARERLSEILFEIITVIGVSWLVALEVLVYFVTVRVAGPLQRLEMALRDGAGGRFAHRIAVRTRDEVGSAIAHYNLVIRNLRYHYDDFRTEAREIRDAQIDAGIARRIDAAWQTVTDRFHLDKGDDVRPRSAMQIRAPLFLFIFSEELSRSFLPLFISRFRPDDLAISSDLLVGLPITLFMLAAAVITPLGAGLSDRFGARRVFLLGLLPVIAGYVGTFLAQGYYDLVLWRVLTGIGYGMIFIASQAWVAVNSDESSRAQGMAVFVGAVFAGTVCGPSIGGILADRIGFDGTFLVSAGVAVIAGLIVFNVLDDGEGARGSVRSAVRWEDWRLLLLDRRFLAVSLFGAIPGKLILSGFLFYLVPLYLSSLGNGQAQIGWIIMLYGVATIACTQLASRLADRSGRYVLMVGAGGLLAGLGCTANAFMPEAVSATALVTLAVVALGVGHALSLTSQLAIVQQIAEEHRGGMGRASVIGAYRVLERTGTVVGPIVAAVLAAYFGYRGAVVGIGLVILGFFVLYALAMMPRLHRSPNQHEA